MRVEVLYIDGCPNHRPLVERVKKVLQQERISVPLMEIEVQDEREAKRMGFLGSPTIRVNGLDVDPKSRAEARLAWPVGTIPVACLQKI